MMEKNYLLQKLTGRIRITKFISLFSLLVCFSFTVQAQYKLRGQVINDLSGEGLDSMIVSLQGTSKTTYTDIQGYFILEAHQRGVAVLTIQGADYPDVSRKIEIKGVNMHVGVIRIKPYFVNLDNVVVSSPIAIRRKTPVAYSTISKNEIEQSLSTLEYPELLNITPGVYATKQGGAYGDSRINVRGFENENVAVMVNGVPMNEMEWGGIYWSNWTALSDVTRSLQVQRGMGATLISAPSVGGSINIITNAIETQAGGSAFYAMGDHGYNKLSFSASSGVVKGWSVSLLGTKTWGDGYIRGTEFGAYSYFANISKRINDDHLLSFTAFGSPQWHNQRNKNDKLTIAEWQKQDDKYQYNASYGFDMNGQRKVSSYNTFHKPQLSLNHYWTINDRSSLSTSLYASFGRGGGYSPQGFTTDYKNRWFGASNQTGIPNDYFRSADGTFDYGAIYDLNQQNANGSLMVMSNSINNHNWYGLVSTYTNHFGNYFDLRAGIDFRHYKGIHTNKLNDLYGGDFFIDSNSRKNVSYKADDTTWQNEKLGNGATVFRDYDAYVVQEGAFVQGEYNRGILNAHISGSVSNSSYWRYDRFYYDKDNARSQTVNFIGYTVKGGANVNLSPNHNLFANIGYMSRAPFFADGVFLQKETSNMINKDAVNEKVFSMEVGYGFRSKIFSANLNIYRIMWMDKAMANTAILKDGDYGTINLSGLNALHQGVELDFTIRPVKDLDINGMFSIGDWHWNSNATGYLYNSSGQPVDKDGNQVPQIAGENHAKSTINLKGVKVGNSAQTTAALGADYRFFGGFRAGAQYMWFGRNYAAYKLTGSQLAVNGVYNYENPWQIPSAGVVNVNLSYTLNIGKVRATILGNVNNLFDQEYIVDAEDGDTHDWKTARVFYGFGRTYSVKLRFDF